MASPSNHSYYQIERAAKLEVYFVTPYHSWKRGTNENTNGLIRQYLPKRMSMADLSQVHCNEIADRLNERPRKRYDSATPLERLAELRADDAFGSSRPNNLPGCRRSAQPDVLRAPNMYTPPVSVAVHS